MPCVKKSDILALAAFLALVTLPACKSMSVIKAFKSDGCSCYPDGTLSQSRKWYDCCLKHDQVYWRGGSWSERRQADIALRKCLQQKGHPVQAWLVYFGVRLGGSPLWPTPFRWGFGWPYQGWYHSLTAEQQALADAEMQKWRDENGKSE